MSERDIYGHGLAFPPRIGPDGRMATVGGHENVRQSIRVLLMTQLRERLMLPDYGAGLHSFLFRPNTVATRQLIRERVQRSLARWEPRVRLKGVTVEADPQEPAVALAVIEYRLVSTGQSDRVSLRLDFVS